MKRDGVFLLHMECLVWNSPGEGKEQPFGASPVETHKDGQRLAAHDAQGESEGAGLVQP